MLPLTSYCRSTFNTAVVRFLTRTPGELQDSIFITPPKKPMSYFTRSVKYVLSSSAVSMGSNIFFFNIGVVLISSTLTGIISGFMRFLLTFW